MTAYRGVSGSENQMGSYTPTQRTARRPAALLGVKGCGCADPISASVICKQLPRAEMPGRKQGEGTLVAESETSAQGLDLSSVCMQAHGAFISPSFAFLTHHSECTPSPAPSTAAGPYMLCAVLWHAELCVPLTA